MHCAEVKELKNLCVNDMKEDLEVIKNTRETAKGKRLEYNIYAK